MQRLFSKQVKEERMDIFKYVKINISFTHIYTYIHVPNVNRDKKINWGIMIVILVDKNMDFLLYMFLL